jgi:hypothetical protein
MIFSTVGDLLRWNRNFTEMKVGGPAFVKEQQQQGRLNDGRTVAYAAGLEVLSYKGLREVSHPGSTAGYSGWLGRYPDQGLSVALLCNTAAADPIQLAHAVADVYLAGVLPNRDAQAPVQVDSASLQARAGLYRSLRDHRTISIELKDGHLVAVRLGSDAPPSMMKVVSAKSFIVGEDGPIAEFESDSSGKVVRLRFEDDEGKPYYYEKVEWANPSRADLDAMTGEYASDEAEVTLRVAFEQDRLVIRRRPDAIIPLTPTYSDGFSSSLGSVRFIRDSGGHVIEMSIGGQRVWDLRLRRIQ